MYDWRAHSSVFREAEKRGKQDYQAGWRYKGTAGRPSLLGVYILVRYNGPQINKLMKSIAPTVARPHEELGWVDSP